MESVSSGLRRAGKERPATDIVLLNTRDPVKEGQYTIRCGHKQRYNPLCSGSCWWFRQRAECGPFQVKTTFNYRGACEKLLCGILFHQSLNRKMYFNLLESSFLEIVVANHIL